MIRVHNRSATFFPPTNATYLMGDFTDWDERPLPINGPLTLEFPEGAYVEYAFLDAQMRPLADPQNPQQPKHAWYDYHRMFTLPHHLFQTPQRSAHWSGTMVTYDISSRFLEGTRTCYVYEPAIFPLATIYVQDGEAFYQNLALHLVADALLERKKIKPVRIVFIEPQDRVAEYWFNQYYENFLLEEVLPFIDQKHGPTKERCLWGASLGGMVSAWLAWKHADIFSLVVSQSGCFTSDPQGGNYYHDGEWLTTQFAQTERLPVRFYLETGQIEWLLAPNRRFAATMAEKGYMHSYQERPAGHNWATWEQGLVPALRYLFGEEKETL